MIRRRTAEAGFKIFSRGVATGWARDFGARVNTPTEHTSG
jgi:hypothetical protein